MSLGFRDMDSIVVPWLFVLMSSSSSVDEDGIEAKLNAADALLRSGVLIDVEDEEEPSNVLNVDRDVFFFFFLFRAFEAELREPNV